MIAEMLKPGIPTIYRGIRFRSRLEAQWAAFFDLLKWRWEYEPFDLAGYIPDFVIREAQNLLVEVKPTSGPNDPVFIEASRKIRNSGWVGGDALIVSYFLPVDACDPRVLAVGWLAERFPDGLADFGAAGFRRWNEEGKIGFCHPWQDYRDRITGEYDGGSAAGEWDTNAEILELWAKAKNTVQFRGAA